MSRKKLSLPEGMPQHAVAAEERLLRRRSPPRIKIKRGRSGWEFSSPYKDDPGDSWFVLLCDAFGTRHGSVVEHFLDCLANLVPESDKWVARDKRAYWCPDEAQFNAALAIINSLECPNEAHAAHAAQLVALHLASMKLGQQATRYADARTTAILAKTTRAYGDGIERLARLQGKVAPRTTHQTFEVHKHEHVHFDGGSGPFGGQVHAPYRDNTEQQRRDRGNERRAALPSPCADYGQCVSRPSGAGEASLPASWWGARLWRSLWRA